jgi:hypothetical protein
VRTAGEFPLLADRTLGKSVIPGRHFAPDTLTVLSENAMERSVLIMPCAAKTILFKQLLGGLQAFSAA